MVRLLIALALVLTTTQGYALPTLDGNTHTLKKKELQLGLLEAHVGLTDTITLSTTWPLYFVDLSNLAVRYQVYKRDNLSFALSTGLFHYRAPEQNSAGAPFTATYTPVDITTSYQFKSLVFSGRLAYAGVFTKGQMQEESSDSDEPSLSDVRGALNMETLVFNPSILWNRGNGFAWVFDLNLSLFQDATAQGNAMFPITIDERTSGRAVVQARAEADLTAQGARNMSISALWWWSKFHLKLGLTMGHLMVPYLNIFLMEEDGQLYKATLPKLDLYWRF